MSKFVALLLLPFAATAFAATQNASQNKKLYCWDDETNGRTCSDTLPLDQVNKARDEFKASNGAFTGTIGQALSAQQLAVIAQKKADEAAENTRQRTEKAALLSYKSEDDLKRVFDDRIVIIDSNVETARYNLNSARGALINKLQIAGNVELAKRSVDPALANDIRQRHTEVLHLQNLLTSFQKQREQVSNDVENSLQRYRDLKGNNTSGTTILAPTS